MNSTATPPDLYYVNAGILMSFTPEVAALHQEDVLNSVLVAQLAADKKFSRFTQTHEWYGFYGDTLGNVAWRTTGFRFSVHQPHAFTFRLNEIVLEEMRGLVTPAELLRIEESIQLLQALPSETKAQQVYNDAAHNVTVVNAQVALTRTGPETKGLGIVFQTSQKIGDVFQEDWDVELLESEIQIVKYEGNLNESVYKNLRESIIKKLGPKREEFICPLAVTSCLL